MFVVAIYTNTVNKGLYSYIENSNLYSTLSYEAFFKDT